MTKAKQNSWPVRLCNWYRFWAKSLALAIMIAMAGTMHIEGRNSLILGQANGGGRRRRRDSRLTTHDCDCTKNHITVTVCLWKKQQQNKWQNPGKAAVRFTIAMIPSAKNVVVSASKEDPGAWGSATFLDFGTFASGRFRSPRRFTDLFGGCVSSSSGWACSSDFCWSCCIIPQKKEIGIVIVVPKLYINGSRPIHHSSLSIVQTSSESSGKNVFSKCNWKLK